METLYRYTPHNQKNNKDLRRDEVITDSRLWFTSPVNFNDPLDSKLDYRQDYSQEEIEIFWCGFLQKKSYQPQMLDNILLRWGSNKGFVELQSRVFDQFRSQMGVCCFSASSCNTLMWSHYADSHKGIVYEFTADLFSDSITSSFKGSPLKIDYAQDNRYELLSYALIDKSKQDQFVKEQTIKAFDWAYEQEYRFIDLNGRGNKAFKKEALKTIIFGAKTPGKEIERVQCLCGQHGFDHVVFKQARFKTGRFEIELIDL